MQNENTPADPVAGLRRLRRDLELRFTGAFVENALNALDTSIAALERLGGGVVTNDAAVLLGQIPPFLSAPTFDDRSEPRVCINGCLYLRADYAGDRTRAALAALKEPTDVK